MSRNYYKAILNQLSIGMAKYMCTISKHAYPLWILLEGKLESGKFYLITKSL